MATSLMSQSMVIDKKVQRSSPLPRPPLGPESMQQEPANTETRSILRTHFEGRSDVLVGGEGYLCFDTAIRDDWLIPDCIVAFGVDPETIRERMGYVINEVGKPPDFVLEIASRSTGRADYGRKRILYAKYGVAEFWRSDYTGGMYHDKPLAGDMLVDGEYIPIELEYISEGVIRGYSKVLELYLCWEYGRLRFYDPKRGEYLRSLGEQAIRADAEAVRADTEAVRADAEAIRADAEAAEVRRLRRILRERGLE